MDPRGPKPTDYAAESLHVSYCRGSQVLRVSLHGVNPETPYPKDVYALNPSRRALNTKTLDPIPNYKNLKPKF